MDLGGRLSVMWIHWPSRTVWWQATDRLTREGKIGLPLPEYQLDMTVFLFVSIVYPAFLTVRPCQWMLSVSLRAESLVAGHGVGLRGLSVVVRPLAGCPGFPTSSDQSLTCACLILHPFKTNCVCVCFNHCPSWMFGHWKCEHNILCAFGSS